MGKKLFFVVVLVLVFSVYTNQNESKAIMSASSASASVEKPSQMHHRYKSPYRILNSRYVARSNVKHTFSADNSVRIRIMQNGMDNTEIEDFSMGYDSGNQFDMGNIHGLEHTNLPLYVKVTYRSWNTFHAVQVDVIYEFIIFSPGTWDVTLFN